MTTIEYPNPPQDTFNLPHTNPTLSTELRNLVQGPASLWTYSFCGPQLRWPRGERWGDCDYDTWAGCLAGNHLPRALCRECVIRPLGIMEKDTLVLGPQVSLGWLLTGRISPPTHSVFSGIVRMRTTKWRCSRRERRGSSSLRGKERLFSGILSSSQMVLIKLTLSWIARSKHHIKHSKKYFSEWASDASSNGVTAAVKLCCTMLTWKSSGCGQWLRCSARCQAPAKCRRSSRYEV